MATIGEALTERQCNLWREMLTPHGTPEQVEEMVTAMRAKHEQEHCRVCGAFIILPDNGDPPPCGYCTRKRRPWPKSRQGYRR